MSCQKHKKYKAKRKPKTRCSACWAFYAEEHDVDTFESEDMLAALTAAEEETVDVLNKAENIVRDALRELCKL